MHSVWTVHTVHNSKICLSKSTNADQKKKKAENVKQKTWTRSPNGHYIFLKTHPNNSKPQPNNRWQTRFFWIQRTGSYSGSQVIRFLIGANTSLP